MLNLIFNINNKVVVAEQMAGAKMYELVSDFFFSL